MAIDYTYSFGKKALEKIEKRGITKIHPRVSENHLTWTYSRGGERKKGKPVATTAGWSVSSSRL